MLEGHTGAVNTLDFSISGEWLLSGSHDGLLYLWPMGKDLWIDQACQRAGRDLDQEEWNKYLFDLPYRETCPPFPSGEES
jgi:WD40 repeat protein